MIYSGCNGFLIPQGSKSRHPPQLFSVVFQEFWSSMVAHSFFEEGTKQLIWSHLALITPLDFILTV